MTDIHAHILPGIDDGPSDLTASTEMARAAVLAGIVTIVATPHLRADFPKVRVDEISDRCDSLRERLADEGITLELVAGAEVALSWALGATDDELRLASYAQRGTDILIETPTTWTSNTPTLLSEVARRGYRIVLAHPERSPELQREPSGLQVLAEHGVILQINADGLLGHPRKKASAKLAQTLASSGIASVLSSDGHRGDGWRPVTALAAARDAADKSLGSGRAELMTCTAPAAVVSGQTLPRVDGPAPDRTRRQARRISIHRGR